MKSLSLRRFASVPTNGTADNSVQLAGYKHCRKVYSLAGTVKIGLTDLNENRRVGILLIVLNPKASREVEENLDFPRFLSQKSRTVASISKQCHN